MPFESGILGSGALLAMLGSGCNSGIRTEEDYEIFMVTQSNCRKNSYCLLNCSMKVVYLFNIGWAVAGIKLIIYS